MPWNRSLPPHLEIRRGGYYWRRRLPRSLRDRGKSGPGPLEHENATRPEKFFFCFSLRNHVLRDARILARRLTEMSDLIFAADAETMMAIAPEIQVTILESLARFEIEAFERTRAIAGPRSPEAAAIELRREEALQDALRRALWLGDREVARHPLRHVAAKLEIEIDDADEDWMALAYETTKVLLDVSQERARRQQGIYDQPTVVFRRAISPAEPTSMPRPVATTGNPVVPASFAASTSLPGPAAPMEASSASSLTEVAAETTPLHAPPAPTPTQDRNALAQDETSLQAPPLCDTTSPTQIVVPAGLDRPANWDDATWQEARIAARPPRILVDRKLLSEASRAALEKQRGITMPESIELYFELLSLGYRPPFDKYQKRKKVPEDLKQATTEERIGQNYLGKYRLARDFWPAVFGDEPVDEIPVDDVNDALERFWGVPAHHGRSEKDRGKYSLTELIEKADAKDAQLERDLRAAEASGASSEEIDRMRLERHDPRISVTTFINHGRVLGNVGRMLMDMQLIDQNPFAVCNWTNEEVRDLKSTDGERKRQAWDDRIHKLWGSRIYQEPLEDVGDPMFWAPLIVGPDDFGVDKEIAYLKIRHTIINGVKTLSSERTLPIHPQLIELGLLKLVELRKQEGHIRLFPFLNRGKQKGTFSANFSKNFAYYRRTNDCYWPGLDFHALRTTFHHDLLGDDKSDAIRCRLMGHTYTDEGDRSYGQNLGIEKLAKRMESVAVDISMVRNPFESPSDTAAARAKKKGLRVVA